MSLTESDPATLRHYLGFSALFLQADPRLDLAISSVQSRADGGTRPDDSTERLIRGWLAQLARLAKRFEELWDENEPLRTSFAVARRTPTPSRTASGQS